MQARILRVAISNHSRTAHTRVILIPPNPTIASRQGCCGGQTAGPLPREHGRCRTVTALLDSGNSGSDVADAGANSAGSYIQLFAGLCRARHFHPRQRRRKIQVPDPNTDFLYNPNANSLYNPSTNFQ